MFLICWRRVCWVMFWMFWMLLLLLLLLLLSLSLSLSLLLLLLLLLSLVVVPCCCPLLLHLAYFCYVRCFWIKFKLHSNVCWYAGLFQVYIPFKDGHTLPLPTYHSFHPELWFLLSKHSVEKNPMFYICFATQKTNIEPAKTSHWKKQQKHLPNPPFWGSMLAFRGVVLH